MRRLRLTLGTLAVLPLLAFACKEDPLTTSTTSSSSSSSGSSMCVAEGAPCPVVFEYPLGQAHSVEVRGDFAPNGWTQGVPLSIDAGEWRAVVNVPNGSTIHYKFYIDGMTYVPDPNNPNKQDDGFGGMNSVKTAQCGSMTNCGTGGAGGASADAFDWRSAVLYFVFVDRFKNGDPSNDAPIPGVETAANYQGGDYQGLLDEINSGYFDQLGVNALWLTVPMDNPSVPGVGSDGHQYSAYHGYWPQNLDQVEEHFGSMALLQQVVAAAHAKNIKVLFDYAMNHVHITAPLYAQHPEWFWPLSYNGNNCLCGNGCAWDGYEGRRCWFTDYLPTWDFQVDAARSASIDNCMFWINQTHIDGFRLDAVKQIETSWISDLRTRINQNVDQSKVHFYMVGETYDTGNRDLIKSLVSPEMLDGQFDFPLRGAIVENILRRSGTMHDLDNFLATNDSFYSPGIMSTFLGNQDMARVINTALDQPWQTWDNGGTSNWMNQPQLPNYRAPFERLGLGFAFLMTTQGIPLIYYGDEIGMPGSGDPDNRRMMTFTGLTTDQQWLKDRVSKLTQLRSTHPALWKGTRTSVDVQNDTYVYEKSFGADVLYVAMNRSDNAQTVNGLPTTSTDLLTGSVVNGPTATLSPRTIMILQP